MEALLHALGAEVTPPCDQRLRIRLPGGQETWLRVGEGRHHPDLDSDAVLRVRHLLEDAGVTPQHPEADPASARGDQSRRLVIHLDHHHTDVFRLEGEAAEHAELRPHGLWGSGENLSHRHDRDIAGQKAPRDYDYLNRIMAAMAEADAILLLGHGTGESDMRQLLLAHVRRHRPDLLQRLVGVETLSSANLTEGELLALAREHFGNLPHRRGQALIRHIDACLAMDTGRAARLGLDDVLPPLRLSDLEARSHYSRRGLQ
ncbi:MAG: hypothetical protein FJ083_02340 [Cyanobacteria bacterium K_Offshore_surface_m2_239]|nr:hypothetical protein [Cyanobacteria bacterium K_Offshore_surface_m2_239]